MTWMFTVNSLVCLCWQLAAARLQKHLRPVCQKSASAAHSSLPKPNGGWSVEIALDVETIHAVWRKLLHCFSRGEFAKSKKFNGCSRYRRSAGANVVSNSYGGPEFATRLVFDKHFNHPKIAFTVSSGDNGYGVEYPAASPICYGCWRHFSLFKCRWKIPKRRCLERNLAAAVRNLNRSRLGRPMKNVKSVRWPSFCCGKSQNRCCNLFHH